MGNLTTALIWISLLIPTLGLAQSQNSSKTMSQTLAKTLEDCFQAALHRSEQVAGQNELIFQAEQRYRQALGAILPTITGTASYLIQDQPTTFTQIFPSNQPLIRVSAIQPLFQGLREFAALRQTQTQVNVQKDAKWQALVLLYQDTATNYFTILSLEQDLRNVQDEIKLYEKRIQELQNFVSIGRSKKSEVLIASVQKETLQAQSVQIETQIQTYREIFQFLTGLPRSTPLADLNSVPEKILPLETYLSEIHNRPDVKSARESVKVADEAVQIAFGGHLPNVNLLGNYYFLRAGAQQNIHWDAQVALTLPIFSGGIIQRNVSLAESQKIQSELTLSRTLRAAQQEISTFHDLLTGDKKQLDSYARVLKLARQNYQAQQQDYRHGLVTNLEVLSALTSFEESQRSLDRFRYSVQLDLLKLEASIARRPQPSEDLKSR